MSASAQSSEHADLDGSVEAVVRGLHANDTKVVLYVTGGTSQVRLRGQWAVYEAGRRQKRIALCGAPRAAARAAPCGGYRPCAPPQ